VASGPHGLLWAWLNDPPSEDGVFYQGGDAPRFTVERDWSHIKQHVEAAVKEETRDLTANSATVLIWSRRPPTYEIPPDLVVFGAIVGKDGMNEYFKMCLDEANSIHPRHIPHICLPRQGHVVMVIIKDENPVDKAKNIPHTVLYRGYESI
jgi:hypothetical protein